MGRPLRIAMIGQRSLPATTGGVEHHVEELGSRLVERGHEVTAFVRNRPTDRTTTSTHRGITLVHTPSVATKHLEAFSHSSLSAARTVSDDFDIVHFHSIGPGLAAPIVRWGSRSKVVLTVHGLDDERAKWGAPARLPLRLGRWMSRTVPDLTITDAAWMAELYRAEGCPAEHVPNGVSPRALELAEVRRRTPRTETCAPSILFVGRLVPEKCPDVLIRAFASVPGDVRLIVVGDSSYTDAYVDSLRRLATADQRIVMPGAVHGSELSRLLSNASVFCLPSQVEGLPLAMLDAAAIGLPVVGSDIPAHRELLGSSGPGHLLVPAGSEDALSGALVETLDDLETANRGAESVGERVRATYDWGAAAESVEGLYYRVLDRGSGAVSTLPAPVQPSTRSTSSTDDRRDRFRSSGFLHIPRFFEPDAVAELREILDEAADDGRRDHVLDRDAMRFSSNLFRRSPSVASFVTQTSVVGLLSEFVDEDLWVRWDQRVVKGPGAPSFPWHQDNAYSHLGNAHLQMWIALTAMDSSNGGLWLDPGSHRRGRLSHGRSGRHAVCKQAPENPIAMCANAGDVVVFSSMMLHGTTPNGTGADRDAYVVEYLPVGRSDPRVERPHLMVHQGGPTARWSDNRRSVRTQLSSLSALTLAGVHRVHSVIDGDIGPLASIDGGPSSVAPEST